MSSGVPSLRIGAFPRRHRARLSRSRSPIATLAIADGPFISLCLRFMAGRRPEWQDVIEASGSTPRSRPVRVAWFAVGSRNQHGKGQNCHGPRTRWPSARDETVFEESDMFREHRCAISAWQEHEISPGERVSSPARAPSMAASSMLLNSRTSPIFARQPSARGPCPTRSLKRPEMAVQNGAPVVGILDAGGARIQRALIRRRLCRHFHGKNRPLLRVIPQISVIMGPCAAANVYSPARQTSSSW